MWAGISSYTKNKSAEDAYRRGGEKRKETHTACTSRISVLQPGTANILISLIDTEVYIGNPLPEPDRGHDTRDTRADHDDPKGTGLVNGAFFHDPFGLFW